MNHGLPIPLDYKPPPRREAVSGAVVALGVLVPCTMLVVVIETAMQMYTLARPLPYLPAVLLVGAVLVLVMSSVMSVLGICADRLEVLIPASMHFGLCVVYGALVLRGSVLDFHWVPFAYTAVAVPINLMIFGRLVTPRHA